MYDWVIAWVFPNRAQADAWVRSIGYDSNLPPLEGPDDQIAGITTSGPISEAEEERIAALAVLYEGRPVRRELRRVDIPAQGATP